jgi:single-stranded DNA-specific DHH superfamily exonuclease
MTEMEEKEGINNRAQTIRKVTVETNKALTEIAKSYQTGMGGKISFTKEDQKRILTASGDIRSSISELLLEVIGMQEETHQAEARVTITETQIEKLREHIRQLTEEKETQTRSQQKKTEGEKDLRGPSQKKLDQLREELHEEAVRE